MEGQKKLEYIYNFSHAASSLMKVDLIKIINERSDIRPGFFSIITFVIGELKNGKRNYDFVKKINIKFSLMEIEGFSFILKQHAQFLLNEYYQKFANSEQGGKKHVKVWQTSKVQKVGNQEISIRTIFIQAKSEQQNITISITPEQAHSIGETLHRMFLLGSTFEIERMLDLSSNGIKERDNNYDVIEETSIEGALEQFNRTFNNN